MARRRRSTKRNVAILIVVVVVGGGYFAWGRFLGVRPAPATGEKLMATTPATEPETKPGTERRGVDAPPVELSSTVQEPMPDRRPARQPADASRLVEDGKAALQRGDLLLARSRLSAALDAGVSSNDAKVVRDDLVRIAQETVFSPRAQDDDALVEMYTIRPGDTLAKIAKEYAVTADLLARINGIKDKNRIRAGQRVKVVKGPFHVRVSEAAFRLDVYLQDTFVTQFPVGLGADDSTPPGEWRVASKLKNPTYYPPRGGRVIPADDPANPLGERWIGLEGVSGEATGQERYGIHGTIDSDSIGRAVSLGCIRLHNSDVEELYDMLVTDQSRVIVAK